MKRALLSCGALLVFPMVGLCQQSVEIDWPSRKITSQPSQIQVATDIQIDVNGVNDVFYTYSISTQSTPAQIDDFAQIQKAFASAGQAVAGKGETSACNVNDFLAAVKALLDAENAVMQLPASSSGCSATAPCSISLGDTNTAWAKVLPLLQTAKTKQADSQQLCTADEYKSAYAQSQAAFDQAVAIGTKLDPSVHVAQAHRILKPDFTTTVEVDEFWHGKPTKNGQLTVTLSNTNTRLTLSAGALSSQLQNRTYSVTPAPSSTGTSNILTVSGRSSYSPLAVALLNYELPRLSSDSFGLAISTGPVIRFGTASNASSFGYFAGLGLHLYHRFYVSPGFNLGQFADYPPGLTAGGPVPSAIGTPAPINRWTWRFGFAFSYRTANFNSLGLGSSATIQPTSATTKAGSTTAKPAPKSTPAPRPLHRSPNECD